MIGVPSYHAIAAMAVTTAMFVAFARGRMSVEIISLLTIAVIAVGLYFFPLPDTQPIDGRVQYWRPAGRTTRGSPCPKEWAVRGVMQRVASMHVV